MSRIPDYLSYWTDTITVHLLPHSQLQYKTMNFFEVFTTFQKP